MNNLRALHRGLQSYTANKKSAAIFPSTVFYRATRHTLFAAATAVLQSQFAFADERKINFQVLYFSDQVLACKVPLFLVRV